MKGVHHSMDQLGRLIIANYRKHRRAIIIWAVVIVSAGMVFKGVMQYPQINSNRKETAVLEKKAEAERNRQAEIDDLSTKVNTDEYIERIASEKLGLVKSNAKIFKDISGDE